MSNVERKYSSLFHTHAHTHIYVYLFTLFSMPLLSVFIDCLSFRLIVGPVLVILCARCTLNQKFSQSNYQWRVQPAGIMLLYHLLCTSRWLICCYLLIWLQETCCSMQCLTNLQLGPLLFGGLWCAASTCPQDRHGNIGSTFLSLFFSLFLPFWGSVIRDVTSLRTRRDAVCIYSTGTLSSLPIYQYTSAADLLMALFIPRDIS